MKGDRKNNVYTHLWNIHSDRTWKSVRQLDLGTVSCDTALAYKRRIQFNSMKRVSDGHAQESFLQKKALLVS